MYTFLDGIDDRLEKIRADVLQIQPFLMMEQVYAQVRREDLKHYALMKNEVTISDVAMLSKG